MTNAGRADEIERSNVFYLTERPKKEPIFIGLYTNILSEPTKKQNTSEILKDDLYRVDFNLGFREPTKINLLFERY
jgi:KUP system potassium uptake protein